MTRRALIAGLASLLITGCSEKTPSSTSPTNGNGPIQLTRITSEQDYDAVTRMIANLEGHTLIKQETGTYNGYAVTAHVYQVKWDPNKEIYAVELVNPTNNQRIYAATPLGKKEPFTISPESSKEFGYTSADMEHIFNTIIKKD